MPALEVLWIFQNRLNGSLPVAVLQDGFVRGVQDLRVYQNMFSGEIPSAIASLTALEVWMTSNNNLGGALPAVIENLNLLRQFQASSNHVAGSLPESLVALKALQRLGVHSNKLDGSINAAFGQMSCLTYLSICSNQLQGSLPDGICTMKALEELDVHNNSLNGAFLETTAGCGAHSLPTLHKLRLFMNSVPGRITDGIAFMTALEEIDLGFNRLTGSIAGGIGFLRSLRQLYLMRNHLAGSIPDAFRSLSALERLALRENKLRGALPEMLDHMRSMGVFHFGLNNLRGSFPDARLASVRELLGQRNELHGSVADGMTAVVTLDLRDNQLSGSLPHSAVGPSIRALVLRCNALSGMLPHSLLWLRRLQSLVLSQNKFTGTLPPALHKMTWLMHVTFNDNLMSGTFPGAYFRVKTLLFVDCGRNLLEGTLPAHTPTSTRLNFLGLQGESGKPCMRGVLPPHLDRLREMSALVAQQQELESAIPALSSTIDVVALHRNSLESLPDLRLRNSRALLLHCNRLSCQLPTGHASSRVTASVVAVGNHLMWPEKSQFPFWISPAERDGLFWYSDEDSLRIIVKVVPGVGLLVFGFFWRVGWRQHAVIMQTWLAASGLHGSIAKMLLSCFGNMCSQVPAACLLLGLALNSHYYVCPGGFSLLNACLSTRSSVQLMVIALARSIWEECQQPWWTRVVNPADSIAGFKKTWLCRLEWMCWIILSIILSSMGAINVATKSLPSFLPSNGHSVKLLDGGIGLFQGLLSGLALPLLARKVSRVFHARRSSLISVASLLCTCMIPAGVVLYLDIACANRWTQWWTACSQKHAGTFSIEHGVANAVTARVLRPSDICTPDRYLPAAACARSIAMKLQTLTISKLVTAVFVLPSMRLLAKRYYTDTDDCLLKVLLLLELGMFLGAALPLIFPLLCIGIFSETLLGVAVHHKGTLQLVSEPGDARLAVLATGLSSLVFYCCFVSDDLLASAAVGLAVLPMLVRAMGLRAQDASAETKDMCR